eukprot:SAG25_NODE_5456_length_655_cov_1.357914_1_plen_83_part_10
MVATTATCHGSGGSCHHLLELGAQYLKVALQLSHLRNMAATRGVFISWARRCCQLSVATVCSPQPARSTTAEPSGLGYGGRAA